MYKILIVDDESIEREGISFLIEKYKLPLEVAQATNGKTALEYMAARCWSAAGMTATATTCILR